MTKKIDKPLRQGRTQLNVNEPQEIADPGSAGLKPKDSQKESLKKAADKS